MFYLWVFLPEIKAYLITYFFYSRVNFKSVAYTRTVLMGVYRIVHKTHTFN